MTSILRMRTVWTFLCVLFVYFLAQCKESWIYYILLTAKSWNFVCVAKVSDCVDQDQQQHDQNYTNAQVGGGRNY